MSFVRRRFEINAVTSFECWIFVIRRDNEPEEFWFKGHDIAEFLEYTKPADAIANNVKTQWCKTWSDLEVSCNSTRLPTGHLDDSLQNDVTLPSNCQPSTVFISEQGLYGLVERSKKPEAVKFTNWIRSEVLGRTVEFQKLHNELQLLKQENENKEKIVQMEWVIREKDLIEEITAKNHALEIQEHKHRTERMDLRLRYEYQTINSVQISEALLRKHVIDKNDKARHELVKSNMDDINRGKVNYIGFAYNPRTGTYKVFRQQWETISQQFDELKRSRDSETEQLSVVNRHKSSPKRQWILYGEPIKVSHGVNVWNGFIGSSFPRLFGVLFSDCSRSEFRLATETELRKQYQSFTDGSAPNASRSGIRCKRLYDESAFVNEEDCVERALVADVWVLRDELCEYINGSGFDSIESASVASDEGQFCADDEVSALVEAAALGIRDTAMAAAYPNEARTLILRRACENENLVDSDGLFESLDRSIQQLAIESTTASEPDTLSRAMAAPEAAYTVQSPASSVRTTGDNNLTRFFDDLHGER